MILFLIGLDLQPMNGMPNLLQYLSIKNCFNESHYECTDSQINISSFTFYPSENPISLNEFGQNKDRKMKNTIIILATCCGLLFTGFCTLVIIISIIRNKSTKLSSSSVEMNQEEITICTNPSVVTFDNPLFITSQNYESDDPFRNNCSDSECDVCNDIFLHAE